MHGKIFKVNASCDIERKLDRGQKVSYSLTGCFVFKSSGTVRIGKKNKSYIHDKIQEQNYISITVHPWNCNKVKVLMLA